MAREFSVESKDAACCSLSGPLNAASALVERFACSAVAKNARAQRASAAQRGCTQLAHASSTGGVKAHAHVSSSVLLCQTASRLCAVLSDRWAR
jgi:hypothetical protein